MANADPPGPEVCQVSGSTFFSKFSQRVQPQGLGEAQHGGSMPAAELNTLQSSRQELAYPVAPSGSFWGNFSGSFMGNFCSIASIAAGGWLLLRKQSRQHLSGPKLWQQGRRRNRKTTGKQKLWPPAQSTDLLKEQTAGVRFIGNLGHPNSGPVIPLASVDTIAALRAQLERAERGRAEAEAAMRAEREKVAKRKEAQELKRAARKARAAQRERAERKKFAEIERSVLSSGTMLRKEVERTSHEKAEVLKAAQQEKAEAVKQAEHQRLEVLRRVECERVAQLELIQRVKPEVLEQKERKTAEALKQAEHSRMEEHTRVEHGKDARLRLQQVQRQKEAELEQQERETEEALKQAELRRLEDLRRLERENVAQLERMEREKALDMERQARENAEAIDRVQSAAREEREKERKMKISDISTTYVAASDHTAVATIMDKIGAMGNVVDIAFCIDGTGSMSGHIDAVKCTVVDLCGELLSAHQLDARVAIVIYRDYGDVDHFEVYGFMESAAAQGVIYAVLARGCGGDEAEDCIGGLHKVTELDWQAPSRVCIWIGDAPTHGRRFHDFPVDEHPWHDLRPDGDPDGRTPEKVLPVFHEKNIDLVFLKIDCTTDKMIDVFRGIMAGFPRELLVYPMKDKDGLRQVLSNGITASVSRTVSKSEAGRAEPKKFTLSPAFTWAADHGCWGAKEDGTVYQLDAYNTKDLDSIIELVVDGPHISDKPARICLTLNPAWKGRMRLVYPCRMDGDRFWSSEQQLVAKESQHAAKEYNTKRALLQAASIQLVAGKFAEEWNKLQVGDPIEYLSTRVIRLPDRPKGKRYFIIEEYLHGEFHKWNNNNGYVSHAEQHPTLQAFAHWTYVRSNGVAMVTDLQGVCKEEESWTGDKQRKYVLTDPAVHTGDPDKVTPHETNLGTKGMARFFSTHRCNELCKHLKLQWPKDMPAPKEEDLQPKDPDSSA